MARDYSLIVAAAVAIVAIVGLVMHFGSASSGAVYFEPWSSSSKDANLGYSLGEQVAMQWTPAVGDQPTFCSVECGNACRAAYESGKASELGGDCYLNCETNCDRISLLGQGVGPGVTR